jgi:hypothetical protein
MPLVYAPPRYQVSHAPRTTGKIVVLAILITIHTHIIMFQGSKVAAST